MGDHRTDMAIARIEQAMSRIEAVAERSSHVPAGSEEESRQLRAEHQALRGRVAEAISQIDQLLASRGHA